MKPLSDGEVRQSEVMRWAQEQAVHLSPSSVAHVLMYLCANAFYKEENREGKKPGNVLTGRTRLRTIAQYTGMSQASVRRALQTLQDECFIACSMSKGGWEQNEIWIAWSGSMDDHRAAVRAGKTRPLKIFQRENAAPKPSIQAVETTTVDATVLPFRPRSTLPN